MPLAGKLRGYRRSVFTSIGVHPVACGAATFKLAPPGVGGLSEAGRNRDQSTS
jgi:hypothetical protein